jgi:RecB family exonuclease
VEVGQAATSTQATSMISRISYSGLREYEQCPYRYYLTRIERLAARPEPVTGTAAALGTAVHAVLERADQVDSIDDLCVKVARTFGLAGPDIKRLRDAVRAFESMAVRGRLRDADRVMREAPILVPVAGVVLSGAIDVIAWSGNRALVVDYKTGAGHSGEDAARSAYQLQAECYALAALSAGAEQVEVVIAETGPGRETSYHYGTDDRFAIEATIGAFVERMRVGEYEPRASYDPHLCERCPGFNASCAVRP